MPSQPSLHLHSPSPLCALSFPRAKESHSGRAQSSPPNPAGQEHFPLYLLQFPYWRHWKASRLQLKHGGQPSGRSSRGEKPGCGRCTLEEFRCAPELHIWPNIASAARALFQVHMCRCDHKRTDLCRWLGRCGEPLASLFTRTSSRESYRLVVSPVELGVEARNIRGISQPRVQEGDSYRGAWWLGYDVTAHAPKRGRWSLRMGRTSAKRRCSPRLGPRSKTISLPL